MDKGQFVNTLENNMPIDGIFLVKEMSQAETRTGKPYLMLTLMDRTGEIAGRVWDNVAAAAAESAPGAIVRVNGLAQSYKDVLQLKVSSVRQIDRQAVSLAWFMPTVNGDIAAMTAELTEFATANGNPHLRKLLLTFFSPEESAVYHGRGEFLQLFARAPAAKNMHHAYIGGLLEHTLAVTRLTSVIAGLYPTIDRDLLVAGGMLHDIGKVKEFTFSEYPFNYSDSGRLMGHMTLAIEMIDREIARLDGFPEALGIQIKHLILSHHGRYEFGSPTLPMMVEAFALNLLDDLDAKVNYMSRLQSQAREPGLQWTDYQRPFERFLYINGDGSPEQESTPQPQAAPAHPPGSRQDIELPGPADGPATRQQQLW